MSIGYFFSTNFELTDVGCFNLFIKKTILGKVPWMLRLYHGRWQKGVSAGGCRNNTGKDILKFF